MDMNKLIHACAPLVMAGWLLCKALRDRRLFQVDGALVLITGGSSGIGRALALLLTARGADVIIVARSEAALREVEAQVSERGWGGRIYGFACDCADGRQVEALVESVRDITGNREAVPDVIINSAGAGRWLMLDESTIEEIKICFDAPVLAAANVTRAFLGGMQRRGAGAIVNIQSPAAITTWGGCTAYVASRWALCGLTLALQAHPASGYGGLAGGGVVVSQVILPQVESDYWTHNPDSLPRLPWIANLLGVRAISCNRAAVLVARAIERLPTLPTHPAASFTCYGMLRVIAGVNLLFPWGISKLVSLTASNYVSLIKSRWGRAYYTARPPRRSTPMTSDGARMLTPRGTSDSLPPTSPSTVITHSSDPTLLPLSLSRPMATAADVSGGGEAGGAEASASGGGGLGLALGGGVTSPTHLHHPKPRGVATASTLESATRLEYSSPPTLECSSRSNIKVKQNSSSNHSSNANSPLFPLDAGWNRAESESVGSAQRQEESVGSGQREVDEGLGTRAKPSVAATGKARANSSSASNANKPANARVAPSPAQLEIMSLRREQEEADAASERVLKQQLAHKGYTPFNPHPLTAQEESVESRPPNATLPAATLAAADASPAPKTHKGSVDSTASSMTSTTAGGLGLIVSAEHNGIQIVVIEADSPAAACKELMRGDVIRAVNDVMTRDKTIHEVYEMLKGETGTKVTLRVKASGPSTPIREVVLVRGR